jgi:hypothetical protein
MTADCDPSDFPQPKHPTVRHPNSKAGPRLVIFSSETSFLDRLAMWNTLIDGGGENPFRLADSTTISLTFGFSINRS